MKHHTRTRTTLGLIGILVFSGSALAQNKIGYVDSQRILAQFPAAVEAQKKLEEESGKWGQELQKMNENLQTMQESLEKQSLLLSDAKKKEKADEMQALYMQIQQYQNQKWGEQGEYFKRQRELLGPVFDQINAAIHTIGQEEDYDYVFDTVAGNIVYAKESYDLTDTVLERLEKESASAGKQ